MRDQVMSDLKLAIENEACESEPVIRETELPDACFSAVIGMICFAVMIFMR